MYSLWTASNFIEYTFSSFFYTSAEPLWRKSAATGGPEGFLFYFLPGVSECGNGARDSLITVRMPRDNKTPLIQKIAKQAYITYKGLKSSANGENKLTADQQSELVSLVTALRAADLKIAPRKSKASSGAAELQSPPVTYMHICETEVFSMGVFLLRSGASIPLHDHPRMNGMLKVSPHGSCVVASSVSTWLLFP